MGKFCTNCGNELDQNASVCLKCGVKLEEKKAKEKKKGLPVWAIVLIIIGSIILIPIILLLILVITGVSFLADNYDEIEKYFEDVIEESVEVNSKNGTVGDTLEDDDIYFTLNNYATYNEIGEHKAKDGKEYLVFFFDIENKDDEIRDVATVSFYGYADGYAIPNEYWTTIIEDKEEINSRLASGMKTSGYIAYEVDSTWKEFEVHYNYLFDEELVFKINNSKHGA